MRNTASATVSPVAMNPGKSGTLAKQFLAAFSMITA